MHEYGPASVDDLDEGRPASVPGGSGDGWGYSTLRLVKGPCKQAWDISRMITGW